MHGLRADMTEEFILKAQDTKPIALLTEGTRTGKDIDQSEAKVRAECSHAISKCKHLAIADFNFKDSDRLKRSMQLLRKNQGNWSSLPGCGNAKYLSEDPKLALPKLNDEHIVIFKQKAASGTYSDEDYATWEKKFYQSLA